MEEKRKIYCEAMDEIKLSEEQKRILEEEVIKTSRKHFWRTGMVPVTTGVCVAACAILGLWVYNHQEPVHPLNSTREETVYSSEEKPSAEKCPTEAPTLEATLDSTEDALSQHVSFQAVPSPIPSYANWEVDLYFKRFALAGCMQDFTEESLALMLRQYAGENFSYSPLSFYLACSVLAECTEGDVQQEMLAFLGVDSLEMLRSQTDMMTGWLYHESKEDDSSVTWGKNAHILQYANSLWVDDMYYPYLKESSKELFQNISDTYRLTTVVGDLQSDALGMQKGQWIQENTNGLLGKDAESNRFDDETVLSIINSLYYKDAWKNPFEEKADRPGIFYLASGETKQVSFMKQSFTGQYGSSETSDYVPLPYCSGAYMVLFRPKNGATPEAALAADLYDAIAGLKGEEAMQNGQVSLSMPGFDITTSHSLLDTLEAMGASSVTAPGSLDSLLSEPIGLHVNTIKQTVRLKVTHSGTEAAAITEIGMVGACPPGEMLEFCLDHPFGYAIVRNGVVLFVGTVYDIP